MNSQNSSGDLWRVKFMECLRIVSRQTRKTTQASHVFKYVRNCHVHSHRHIEQAGFRFKYQSYCSLIFKDTSPYCILINCTALLLISSSKICQILWHPTLYSKFHLYKWFWTAFQSCISFIMTCIVIPY